MQADGTQLTDKKDTDNIDLDQSFESEINNESGDEVLDSTSKIEQLEQQVAQLNEQLLRSYAESENRDKRNRELLAKSKELATGDFVKKLIEDIYPLEMALKDNSNNFDSIKQGIQLTYNNLIKRFEANGIEVIMPQSKQKLDPNLHEAISIVDSSEHESNTIVEVLQCGYKAKDRVLYHAKVVVAK